LKKKKEKKWLLNAAAYSGPGKGSVKKKKRITVEQVCESRRKGRKACGVFTSMGGKGENGWGQ